MPERFEGEPRPVPEFVAAWAAWTADHMIMAQRARLSEGKPSDMQEKIDKGLSPPTSRAARVERSAGLLGRRLRGRSIWLVLRQVH